MFDISLFIGNLLFGCLVCHPVMASYARVIGSDDLAASLSSCPFTCSRRPPIQYEPTPHW